MNEELKEKQNRELAFAKLEQVLIDSGCFKKIQVVGNTMECDRIYAFQNISTRSETKIDFFVRINYIESCIEQLFIADVWWLGHVLSTWILVKIEACIKQTLEELKGELK